MGFFEGLKKGLLKTKEEISKKVNQFLSSFRSVDEDFLDQLEEILISSDVSVETSVKIRNRLRDVCKLENVSEAEDIKKNLKKIISEILYFDSSDNHEEIRKIILMVGVNGVGKTTSIAKIANLYKNNGKKVLIAAADTFRAAACEQIEIWSNRVECPIVKKEDGADPGSVVFEAISRFKSENFDIMICDTAGRLHNKSSLMDELRKLNRIVDKNAPDDSKKEIFLVLDACTGQNMVNQVEEFSKITEISGIVLTKLDGTAKGGAIISVRDKFSNIPIVYTCVGEKIGDICEFSSTEFSESFFD